MMNPRFALVLFFGLVTLFALPAKADVAVSGPDGQVQFLLTSAQDGGLIYSVQFRNKPVIESSRIGIVVDGVNLSERAEIGSAERYKRSEKYPWYGGKSVSTDNCNGAKIPLRHPASGTLYTLEVRAFDDGVGFRFLVPGSGRRVPGEATTFGLPAGSTVWYHDLEDHYEGVHVRKGLRAVPEGAWAAPPLTVRLPENTGYAAITEGALQSYSGLVLQADGKGGFQARLGHAAPAAYPFRLRYEGDVERLSKPATIDGPITTPWRVVMAGSGLNELANADIIHNLAAPPDPKLFPEGLRTSWVKPGRAVWSYLDGGTRSLEGMKDFSRLASELGFEYNLLEGFWAKWPESDLKQLVDYSRERGVEIILWKHSRDLREPQKLTDFFEMCRRTGAAGAKIDFFDHEHKEVVELYETILRRAAEYRLIIDFHGANKPTGLERTFPNMLGFEGIRGMEMRPPWAQHDTTLPFTRMLAGLADFTPTHFGRRMGDTTWAHQVANAIVLNAPLLVYAAHPANILANPTSEIVKSIPSVWDETRVLAGSEIGEVTILARRKGDTWFLAVTNGPYARTVKVDLDFLGEGSYQSLLARDDGRADSVRMEHITSARSDSLFIEMRSGGGFAGRFTK